MIEGEFENIYEARDKVYETGDKLTQAQRDMANRLQKRALELGITKEQFKGGYFKELNIMDMLKNKKGEKVCPTCYMNKKCNKHSYERQGKKEGKPYNEKEIYDIFNPQKKG